MVGWRSLRNLGSLAIGTGTGLTIYFYQSLRDPNNIVHNAFKYSDIPLDLLGKWDTNWDYREPKTLVSPIKDDTRQELERYNSDLEKVNVTATRHIVLVRHGQYLYAGKNDEDHHLTELGRLQAKYTGQRLHELGIEWDEILVSTMTRAQETSQMIFKEIEYVPDNVKNCEFLRECIPISPDLQHEHWKLQKIRCAQDTTRIEAAFRLYFHRAFPEQQHDSYTLIVAHANVIRYIVCRALQLPIDAWLRLNVNHGSITWLTIAPSGHVSLRYLGECGYLPAKSLTTHLQLAVKEV